MPARKKQKPLERGGRVYLRRPMAGDAKEVIATVRASRRLHRPWVYPTDTKTAFDGYIRRNQENEFVGLLVCRIADDRIVGMANLSQIFRVIYRVHIWVFGLPLNSQGKVTCAKG